MSCFNPILVQFKPSTPIILPSIYAEFQSYLSPIQTWPEGDAQKIGCYMFQSYLSPIQTDEPDRLWRRRSRFNPILVQFKQAVTGPQMPPVLVFQSYLSPIQTTCSDMFSN